VTHDVLFYLRKGLYRNTRDLVRNHTTSTRKTILRTEWIALNVVRVLVKVHALVLCHNKPTQSRVDSRCVDMKEI